MNDGKVWQSHGWQVPKYHGNGPVFALELLGIGSFATTAQALSFGHDLTTPWVSTSTKLWPVVLWFDLENWLVVGLFFSEPKDAKRNWFNSAGRGSFRFLTLIKPVLWLVPEADDLPLLFGQLLSLSGECSRAPGAFQRESLLDRHLPLRFLSRKLDVTGAERLLWCVFTNESAVQVVLKFNRLRQKSRSSEVCCQIPVYGIVTSKSLGTKSLLQWISKSCKSATQMMLTCSFPNTPTTKLHQTKDWSRLGISKVPIPSTGCEWSWPRIEGPWWSHLANFHLTYKQDHINWHSFFSWHKIYNFDQLCFLHLNWLLWLKVSVFPAEVGHFPHRHLRQGHEISQPLSVVPWPGWIMQLLAGSRHSASRRMMSCPNSFFLLQINLGKCWCCFFLGPSFAFFWAYVVNLRLFYVDVCPAEDGQACHRQCCDILRHHWGGPVAFGMFDGFVESCPFLQPKRCSTPKIEDTKRWIPKENQMKWKLLPLLHGFNMCPPGAWRRIETCSSPRRSYLVFSSHWERPLPMSSVECMEIRPATQNLGLFFKFECWTE